MLYVTLHQDLAVWTALFAGVLLGGVWDVLAAVRGLLGGGMAVTAAADLLMGAAAGVGGLWMLYRANEGELRLILLAAMAMGALVYRAGAGDLLRRLCRPRRGKKTQICE